MIKRNPAKKEYRCTVSGLPVLELEEFQNRKIAEDYYLNIKKIGDSIILHESRGNLANIDMEKYYQVQKEFIRKASLIEPYIEIRDFTNLRGRPPMR